MSVGILMSDDEIAQCPFWRLDRHLLMASLAIQEADKEV